MISQQHLLAWYCVFSFVPCIDFLYRLWLSLNTGCWCDRSGILLSDPEAKEVYRDQQLSAFLGRIYGHSGYTACSTRLRSLSTSGISRDTRRDCLEYLSQVHFRQVGRSGYRMGLRYGAVILYIVPIIGSVRRIPKPGESELVVLERSWRSLLRFAE